MDLVYSPSVERKLREKHDVEIEEVHQCFLNRETPILIDDRPNNTTEPPTRFFIAKTDKGRTLKVAFILHPDEADLKTAYEPSQEDIDYYNRNSQKT